VKYFGLSDQGKTRTSNQDSFIVVKNPASNILAVVCDGIGGAKNGDWASNLVVQKLGEAFQETGTFTSYEICRKWLRTQLNRVNEEIYQKSLLSADCRGMGTTVVALIIHKNGVAIVNCGDSRCYQLQGEHLIQITRDHTIVSALVAKGALSKKEAIEHPKRHILSRAVGAESKTKFDFYNLTNQVETLLLCSDGLFGLVEDEDIERVVKKDCSCEKKAKELLEIANNNGGYDNITVVLLER